MNSTNQNRIDSILASPTTEWSAKWKEIDEIIFSRPTEAAQQADWERIQEKLAYSPHLEHVYFRLAILHLLRDADEKEGIAFLGVAYSIDIANTTAFGRPPQTLRAYRLLSFIKAFFEYLADRRQAKKPNWEAAQFQGEGRRKQIETLLIVFDASLIHPLDSLVHTYQTFFSIMRDKQLIQFAIENYFCAEEMLVEVTLEGRQAFRDLHQYAYARAVASLLGGVLEAIMADITGIHGLTLGGILNDAYQKGFMPTGSRLAALGSLMLYLRNHIHADRAASRTEYWIDLNVARGFKAALDSVITQMVSHTAEFPSGELIKGS